jgi:hypothetical protein
LNKGDHEKKKKQIIIGAIAGGIIIVLIIIILILIPGKSSKNGEEGEEGGERTTSPIGQINLVYDVQNTMFNTQLLGNEFKKEYADFDIYVGEKK